MCRNHTNLEYSVAQPMRITWMCSTVILKLTACEKTGILKMVMASDNIDKSYVEIR